MKPESTYADIIEDKVKEWHGKIDFLNEQTANAPADTKANLESRIKDLHKKIESATITLFELDKQENRDNTLAIKSDILEIFDSIDKALTTSEKKTPYML